MARKRRRGIPSSSSEEIETDGDFGNEDFSELEEDSYHISRDESMDSDDSLSFGDIVLQMQLYQKTLKDLNRMKDLKKRLQLSLMQSTRKPKTLKRSKDAFTRFSVTTFSSVIDGLTPHQKDVIESYGFGSLLLFEKCFVPNKFVQWVAGLVDYKSGDIIVGGKIISLTKQSVYYVLGIPLGGKPYPVDFSHGKSIVLQKFKKQTIPSVNFFEDALQDSRLALSDQDIFICFILVALNSFLWPNSSTTPSVKHFGIFEDIDNAKQYDWSGYVLSWLLEHIKSFARSRGSKVKDSSTLGGCLYYLSVLYLDFVDFGHHRVPQDLPRISFWKTNMLKTYSDLDIKSPGIYGFRLVLDIADTCYAQRFTSGGKLPVHGPRRIVKPGILFRGEYETNKNKISVSNSELRNYKAICHLAYSQFSNEDAIVLGKVRCTFWSLGESLKPGGSVNQFVLSAFFYSLYINPAGRPDISKSHYFFANISDNLLKESEQVNDDVLARAFKRASRTRPFHHCNCLYFPILFKEHWSVFVVDIKDHKWVFLDSLYHKDHEYQEELRDKIVPSFQENWDRYIQTDMNFDDYDYLYPVVPQQALDNSVDSRIYAMMFLEHWNSPRTVLHKIFDAKDVPSIRVKIANDLLFLPGNSSNKHRVIKYDI